MKLTIIADTAGLMEAVGKAVMDAGFSVENRVLLDKVEECPAHDSDAVIIACRQIDDLASKVLCGISQRCHAPILLVSDDTRDEAVNASVNCGASVHVSGCDELHHLEFLLRVAAKRYAQMEALLNELTSVKSALEHRKLVERAKGIIMKQRHMDEDSAYRAMRKLAMDNNKKMHEVAEQIITAAELLTA